MPVKPVGDNTFVVSLNGGDAASITMNGQDATDFFGRKAKGIDKMKPAAMLMNGLSIFNTMTQFPHNKGDWFSIHAFKIEQLRPPLEDSSEAAVDLTVPGAEPITVTIEVVDAWNDSKGYVLRDAQISPGKYRLYWDGVDQKSRTSGDTAWVGAGSFTFRLTTSKTAVHYCGEINNSAPKYTSMSYQLVNSSALTITPPGTVSPPEHSQKWIAKNNADDTRKLDTTDSVQFLTAPCDAAHGAWIASDGAAINTEIGDLAMEHGRGLAMTPPDPSDPEKQFYFGSQEFRGGNAIVSASFHNAGSGKGAQPKILSSPDWNRTKPGFVPYQIQIGQVPGMLGQQHELFFKTAGAAPGEPLRDNFVVRNVRLYEEGCPDPGPITLDPGKFSIRPQPQFLKKTPAATPLTTVSETAPPEPTKPSPAPKSSKPIASGTVTVEDNGHAVHFNNAPTVNYPMNYTITDKTILAFDLDVIDCTPGKGNGIGFSPEVSTMKQEDALRCFDFMGGKVTHDPRQGFNDPALGAYSYPTYQPNTLYTDAIPEPPATKHDRNFLWQPGFYGLKISEDGKFLFACNNADNVLEVCDISTDGHIVAKIPIDYPMYGHLSATRCGGSAPGNALRLRRFAKVPHFFGAHRLEPFGQYLRQTGNDHA